MTSSAAKTDFEGEVRVEADISSGKGNYRVSDVRASGGTSPAPFQNLTSKFEIKGNQISSITVPGSLDSGKGQPLGKAYHSVTNGAFYGPNAAEVGAGYQIDTTSGRINGAFVAKR